MADSEDDVNQVAGDPQAALPGEAAFGSAVGQLGPRVLDGLNALEQAFRRLHPPVFPALRNYLAPLLANLEGAIDPFASLSTPPELEAFHADLLAAAHRTRDALAALALPGAPEEGAARALSSMHDHAQAQARLYPLRTALPPVSAYFAEAFARDRLSDLEAQPMAAEGEVPAKVGLFRSAEPGARGGFDLYVPESYSESDDEPWPLVMALHGGAGNGADFLWTWLREARSRKFILIAPTSQGSTWSFDQPSLDGEALRQMVEWVSRSWRIDPKRILLTGLSDGATMTLLVGAAESAPYTHLAPVSGVLHPANFSNGNIDRMEGRPVFLVHGALDWMFPVALARDAARVLSGAGAALLFREIEDLSHTYPREMNAEIIEWLCDAGISPDA
ncbi:MAG: phospholipase [Myxococcota bacterium]